MSAQGEGFQVVIGGQISAIGGTSASSPTFAGIIALLNDYKLAQDGSTLGFLNPLLYANPSAFNDITSGSNPGCGTNGFTAVAGWDPVTGTFCACTLVWTNGHVIPICRSRHTGFLEVAGYCLCMNTSYILNVLVNTHCFFVFSNSC